jgi:hypothetical protein
MSFFAIKATLMSILPFYQVDFPVDLFPKELNYLEYKLGTETASKTLTEKETETLKEFIFKNKDGWRYDLTTYAPARYFRSPSMTINCSGAGLVVNYADKDNNWVQISKKASGGACPAIENTSTASER